MHILKEFGYPVYLDIGHAIRKYGIPSSNKEGGTKEFIFTLGQVARALKCGIFVEVHPSPSKALCDAATQLSFKEFITLMEILEGPL